MLPIKNDGRPSPAPFADPLPLRQCTFERIYFSRGNDPDIYEERKQLGRNLAGRVLESINYDIEHAVFSFIPNTAETAFLGLVGETQRQIRTRQAKEFWDSVEAGSPDAALFKKMNNGQIRAEKIAHKDQRLRTFITHDAARRDLVMHIYDISSGVVQSEDTLVVLDDSIVRGTTLRESIITILSRLNPKKIVITSSAPPIKYPDCYGIDMSHLNRFIAFQAAIALLKDEGRLDLLDAVEHDCRAQAGEHPTTMVNHVRRIYDCFSLEKLSAKIGELVTPDNVEWTGELQIIYQDVDGLRAAMPGFTGDWYFTGDYPTPGGLAVLNQSYLNWRDGHDKRSY